MTAPPFEPSREDKLRVLEELRQDRPGTRAAYTRIVSPEPSGRWAKPDLVTGREPFVDVPRLPSNSPWAQEQPGLEPPFDGDINFVEVCGTSEEAERAAAILSAATDNLQGGSCGEAGNSSPATEADDPPYALPGSLAEGPSPAPEGTSPLPPDESATDPTLSSSRGSDPSASSFAEDRQLGPLPSHPGNTPERRASSDRGRGSGSPFSRPSFRRIG